MLSDRPYPNKGVLLLIVGFLIVDFLFFFFILSTITRIIRIVASGAGAWATGAGGFEDEPQAAKAYDFDNGVGVAKISSALSSRITPFSTRR
jgi:hypothetical protein